MTKKQDTQEEPELKKWMLNPWLIFLHNHWKVLLIGIFLGTTILYFKAYIDLKASYNFCASTYNLVIDNLRTNYPLVLQNMTG